MRLGFSGFVIVISGSPALFNFKIFPQKGELHNANELEKSTLLKPQMTFVSIVIANKYPYITL